MRLHVAVDPYLEQGATLDSRAHVALRWATDKLHGTAKLNFSICTHNFQQIIVMEQQSLKPRIIHYVAAGRHPGTLPLGTWRTQEPQENL